MFEIVVATNSTFYTHYLLNNIIKTVSDCNNISIFLALNDESYKIDETLRQFGDKLQIKHEFILTPDLPLSSKRHGTVLNEAVKRLSSEVGMFVDQDIAFCCKDWDKLFLELLQEPNVVAVGNEWGNLEKNLGFPCVVCCAFKTNLVKEWNVDFRPPQNSASYYNVKSELESVAWKKKINERLILDTGCYFPISAAEHGYVGKTLSFKQHGILSLGHECYHNGKLVVSHRKASSFQHNITDTSFWMKLVDEYIEKNNTL